METGLQETYGVLNEKKLKQALRRFSRIDSKRLLNFSERLLREDLDLSLLTKVERLMVGMFHYTVWGDKPSISYKDSIKDLKENNPDIVKELLDIIDYNKGTIKSIEIEYEDSQIPLDIYASYSVQQIMVADRKSVV